MIEKGTTEVLERFGQLLGTEVPKKDMCASKPASTKAARGFMACLKNNHCVATHDIQAPYASYFWNAHFWTTFATFSDVIIWSSPESLPCRFLGGILRPRMTGVKLTGYGGQPTGCIEGLWSANPTITQYVLSCVIWRKKMEKSKATNLQAKFITGLHHSEWRSKNQGLP